MKKIVIEERGFVLDKIPPNIYKELLFNLEVNNLTNKKPAIKTLAGNMEKEFAVTNLIPESFYPDSA